MCNRIFTPAEEDELVHYIVKTTHESLLKLISFRRRVSGENIDGDILGNSSKDALNVSSDGICPSCGVGLSEVIQENSVDRLEGDDGTLQTE